MDRTPTRRAALVGALLLLEAGHSAAAQEATRSARPGDVTAVAITPSMIQLGDQIFHGKAARGTCFMCHGADARGTPGLAPNLTDAKWLNGDGSYSFILHVVQNGIASPKESSMPMPPMGGSALTPAQAHAVAAYVYSLSHPTRRSGGRD